MLRPKKILVPTDFSEYSDKALNQALDIAKQYNAQVFLFHVVPKEVNRCVADVCLGDDVIRDIENQMIARAQEDLNLFRCTEDPCFQHMQSSCLYQGNGYFRHLLLYLLFQDGELED